jgi:hypothetical protein
VGCNGVGAHFPPDGLLRHSAGVGRSCVGASVLAPGRIVAPKTGIFGHAGEAHRASVVRPVARATHLLRVHRHAEGAEVHAHEPGMGITRQVELPERLFAARTDLHQPRRATSLRGCLCSASRPARSTEHADFTQSAALPTSQKDPSSSTRQRLLHLFQPKFGASGQTAHVAPVSVRSFLWVHGILLFLGKMSL